jgi:hypothetical protein
VFKLLRFFKLLGFLCVSQFSLAQDVLDDHYSLGLRFGALIGQQRLASPPLPSLDKNKKTKFGLQGAYVGGQIDGTYYIVASDGANVPVQLYSGYSRAYSGGLAYTSPSFGPYSIFAFGIYTQGAANFPINFSNVNFENSKLISKAGGMGANYVLSGDGDSFFKLGLFGGVFISVADTSFDYVMPEGGYTPGTPSSFDVTAGFTDYGPMGGLQAEITLWKFHARSFVMYARDFTNKCVDLHVNEFVQSCFTNIDSTFGSYGLSLGALGFNLTIYSKLWGKIDDFDVRFEKYQLGYTLAF